MKTLKMMIMPANNLSGVVHYLAGAYPGSVGMLISPGSYKRPPFYLPYAIDNGAFIGFEEVAFQFLLRKVSLLRNKPIFVAVPDCVGDAEETNRLWHQWHDKIEFPLAFVAQDGHEPQDIPTKAHAVFVGGSTDWKLSSAHKFKSVCKWLHIGRVNTLGRLHWAVDIGADSIDGSGWFRGIRERNQMIRFITRKDSIEL
jgi:hypothetical protein